MSSATASFYKVNEGVIGQHRFVDLAIDVTSGGSDGVALAAGSAPLDGWRKITWVTITGAVETGGYVAQYVVTSEATDSKSGGIGNGSIIFYESDDAVDPLDPSTDAVGVVYVRVEGY